MSSQVRIAEKKSNRRFWPLMGFVLIVALTVIAYIVAPDVITWMRSTFRQFRPEGMTSDQLRLVFTAIVFVVLALIAALIIAIAAPKKPINVDEGKLMKERSEMVKAKRAAKKRQRRVNRAYREHVEGKNK